MESLGGLKMLKKLCASVFALIFSVSLSYSAVGCDLNEPDRDVKRLFPDSTGYKTKYVSIDKTGGQPLLKKIETRLGDNFKGLYETIDVPYTLYEIYKNDKIIGYIHGVNQKGTYGGIQVFLAFDTKMTIDSFYVQKLTSRKAKEFRTPEFAAQFKGLTSDDFEKYDVAKHFSKPDGKVSKIKNPAVEASDDFYSILRAVKKNLILTDEFIFKNKEAEIK